jgi:hypothetical protein
MDEDSGNTMCWLSYWRGMDSLQAFAHSPVHERGMVWMTKIALSEYPGLGIMHEMYHGPKGHWETILLNIRPLDIQPLNTSLMTMKQGRRYGKAI